MLFTSWVRSFRQSLQNCRRRNRRGRDWQTQSLHGDAGRRSRNTEQLEERMLLTAFVVNQQFVDANFGSINISNDTLDTDGDGTPEFDSVVFYDATVPGIGGAGINVNLSDLKLNRIVFQGIQIGEQGDSNSLSIGVNITLNNIDLDSITFDETNIFSGVGDGLDIELTDVHLGKLAISNSTIVASVDEGLTIDATSVSRNTVIDELAVSGSRIDGIDLTAVGLQKSIINASQENPIVITTSDHGLQTGTEVRVSDVSGLTAANTRDTITVVNENNFNLANTDGSMGAPYISDGTVTVTTDINNLLIVENIVSGTADYGGVNISLTDARIPNLRIQDNESIDSIDLSLTRTPVDGLSLLRNKSINATRPGVNGINFDLNQSTMTNLNVNGNRVARGASASGGEGVVFTSVDSNVYGSFSNNTVVGTLGSGLKLVGSSSSEFLTENRGPLVFDFNSTFSETSLASALTAGASAVQVADGRSFQAQQIILIGEEHLFVESISGNTLNVRRGQRGTLAIAHASGTPVRSVTTSASGELRSLSGNRFERNAGAGISALLSAGASLNAVMTANEFSENDGGGVIVSATETHAVDTLIARGGISRTATTLNVTDSSVFSNFNFPFDVAVESEILTVTAIDENALTVVRGVNGTAAAFHDTSSAVTAGSGDGLNLTIGGDAAGDGNQFDRNRFAAIDVQLYDAAAGRIEIVGNSITNTFDSGDGISVTLTSVDNDIEATAILRRSRIDKNLIGVEHVTTLNSDVLIGSTIIQVTDGSNFLPNDVLLIDGEELTIQSVAGNIVILTAATTAIHLSDAIVLSTSGSNTGRGVDIGFDQQTAIEDLKISDNTIANNLDDGIRILREDEAITRTVNPVAGQTRSVTIVSNTVSNNAQSPEFEQLQASGLEQFGSGVELVTRNGGLDELDVELRGNTIKRNARINSPDLTEASNGINVRAEADAQILIDVTDNNISRNEGNGLLLTTRENSDSDDRDVSGTLTKNSFAENGKNGIEVVGRFGLASLFVVGLEGVDPVDSKSRGNSFIRNDYNGINIRRSGSASIANNNFIENGQSATRFVAIGVPTPTNTGNTIDSAIIGSGIHIANGSNDGLSLTPGNLGGNLNLNIKKNIFDSNRGMGIDINSYIKQQTNVTIRSNVFQQNENDGIEISGPVQATLIDNFIGQNEGRGIDILNFGDTNGDLKQSNYQIGNGQFAGRNTIVGNLEEGIYYASSAGIQDQNLLGDNPASRSSTGVVVGSPAAILQVDTNTISDNGVNSASVSTGLVFWIGTSGSGSSQSGVAGTDNSYAYQTPLGSVTGLGSVGGVADQTAIALSTINDAPHIDAGIAGINSRTNAKVVNNTFEGNFGDDFGVQTFISTVEPPVSSIIWRDPNPRTNTPPPLYHLDQYTPDPLARLNLVFENNAGNGLGLGGNAPGYSAANPEFKGRVPAPRNATRVPSRFNFTTGQPIPPLNLNAVDQLQANGTPDAVYPILDIQPFDVGNGIQELQVSLGPEIIYAPNVALPYGGVLPFIDGATAQIGGVQSPAGSIHSANGVYQLSKVDPVGRTVVLQNSAGEDGPLYVSGGFLVVNIDNFTTTGGARRNTTEPLPENRPPFQFAGQGPTTLRVAQGYDTSGTSATNQFANGDNFNNVNGNTEWGIWTPSSYRNGVITDITVVNPMALQITSPNHGISDRRLLTFSKINGIPSANNTFEVEVTGVDTFEITDPRLSVGNYIDGGEWKTRDASFPDPIAPTFPLVSIVGLSPSIRSTPAGTVTLDFTEPVTNLDVGDLFLTHDGIPVDISSLVLQQESPNEFTIDLSSVTAAEGQYELRVDNDSPTAVIDPVRPDPRPGPVDFVTVNFTEDVTGVDISDFVLSHDDGDTNGFQAIDLSEIGANLAVTPVRPSQYTIDLSTVTSSPGVYRISLLAPRDVLINSISVAGGVGTPVSVNALEHGLSTGQTVTLSGVSGELNSFNTIVNGTFRIIVVDPDSFILFDDTLTNPIASDEAAFLAGGTQLASFDPEIIDRVGKAFATGRFNAIAEASESWVRISNAPTADIVDIAPDPRGDAVTSVIVTFSQSVNSLQFTNTDLRLLRDVGQGFVNVSLSMVQNPFPLDADADGFASRFMVPNLAGLTDVDGNYRLTLITTDTSRISDEQGAFLSFPVSDDWTRDSTGLIAAFTPVFPRQRQTGVSAVLVTFNDAVSNVNLADASTHFALTRDAGDGNGPQAVPLVDPATSMPLPIVQAFSSALIVDLSPVTEDAGNAVNGDYALTLTGDSGIVSVSNGDELTNDLVETWVQDNLSPLVNVFDVSPSPRIDNAGTISVGFSEPVAGIDVLDASRSFELTLDSRDGSGAQSVPLAGLRVRPVFPVATDGTPVLDPFTFIGDVFASTYLLDLRDLTNAVGDYVFSVMNSLNASDLSGNPSEIGSASTSWSRIANPINDRVVDAIFPGNPVPPFESGRPELPNFLVNESVQSFFVDTTLPEVVSGSVDVTPELRSTSVGILTIDFTEPVTGFNLSDLRLTRDGNPVSLDGLILNQITQSRYTIDLNLTTGAAGDYVLSIQGSSSLIEDLAGNSIQASLINLDSWTVESIGPSATVLVTPNPRTIAASNVQITFTKEVEVAQLDITDFRLERDTGSGFTEVVLSGATISADSPSLGFDDSFTLDLSAAGLTDIEAAYRLTLVASNSNIVDQASIGLISDASDIWVLDNSRPTADIIDISLDPRQTEVGTVNILFSEGVTGVDIADFVLLKDSVPVDIAGLTVIQQTSIRYTVDLSSVTTDDATYELRLRTDDGITPVQDFAGNTLSVDDALGLADTAALDGWFKGVDVVGPTVDIVDVLTPRPNSVGTVILRFSENVSGVDINDIELSLDTGSGPGPVDISGLVVGPVPGSATDYQLDLSTVTVTQGTYALRVVTTDVGSPIGDAAGNSLAQSFAAGVADEIIFVVQAIDPVATIETVTPDPRLQAVGILSVTFSKPVQGLDLADFILTRDTGFGPQLVSLRDVTLEQSPAGPDAYFLDLSRATGASGVYSLILPAETSGITEISTGDPMTSDAIETWTTITTITVNTTNDTVDVSPGDGVVADLSGNVSLRAAIMESNALAVDNVIELPAGDYSLSIGGVGEEFSASGDLDVRNVGSRLTILGAGADVTTIDAASLERVFHVFAGSTFDIEGVTITGGLVTGSEDGGGVRNDGGTVSITDSVITGNVSQDDAGGINNTGDLTLTRVTVSDNSAARTGGGIRNSGQLTVVESTIGGEHDPTDPLAPDLRNTAVLGGGGIINLNGGTLTASNSTISGNASTTSQGAGLFTIGRGILTNVTVSNNEAAAEGGGIAVADGLLELRNTIVAGNVSVTATVDIFDGTAGVSLASRRGNLIGDNTGATVAFFAPAPNPNPNANGDFVGTAATPINPLLGALTDNGGATLTHYPLLGSPVIDAGELSTSVRDQRGLNRNLNGVDIGAVEFGGFFVNSTADSIDINPGDGIVADSFGRRTLRAAIMESNALPGESAIQLGDGTYELSVTEIDTTPPTADIVDVTPDPLSAQSSLLDPVDEIVVNFSEPVQGINLANASANFTLTFDDGTGSVAVPLTGITVRQDSDTQYVIEGLTALLAQDGLYDLRLLTTGIADFALAPNTLAEDPAASAVNIGSFDTFVRGADVFAPTAMLSQVSTPRTTNPGAVTLTFSESVFGVDLSSNPTNFALTYDDDGSAGPNVQQVVALNAVAVQQITSSEYVLDLSTVRDFTGLTDPGEYALTFDGTATTIFDFSANAFTGTPLSTTWLVQPDTTPPSADIVDISPDPRIGAVGVTTIDFAEDVTGVDLTNADTDFDLFRDIDGFGTGASATQIDISGLTVTQVTASQYTVDLSTVTAGDGEYRFVVRTDGLVVDLAGSPLDATLGAGDVAEDFWATGDTFASVSLNDAASFGDLDITAGDLVIIGNSESTSIIDANHIDRVFDVFSGTSLGLQNVTVTGGQTVGGNDGGGVRSLGALAVIDSALIGNSTDADGGAIYTAGTVTASTLAGDINSIDSVITVSNAATFSNQPGFLIIVDDEQMKVEAINGAVFTVTRAVNGTIVTDHSDGPTVTVVDLLFDNVTATTNTADFGAAVFNDGGNFVLLNGTFTSNAATTDGGGIYNDRTAKLSVVGARLDSNTAGRDGGGIYNNDNATALISSTTVNVNSAGRNGGGLFNEIVANANVVRSQFSGNSAIDGGGIYNEDGLVDITDSSLIANFASNAGGGLNATASATTTVVEALISGNMSGAAGGAFANDGTLSISNTTVTNNTTDGDGAALANSNAVTIDMVVLSNNAAAGSGGAIHNDSDGNVTLTATTVSDNFAGVDGGGVANTDFAVLTIGNSTLDANNAGVRGGGLFHSSASAVIIMDSTISNNSAANGGGIGADGTVQVTESTISGNNASVNGGGVNNSGVSDYRNVTIVRNSATANGGGVFSSNSFGPARLKNTIVARNSAATGVDVDGSGFVTQGNNLIGDGGAVSVFVDGIAGDLVGATGTEIDPLVGPLHSNGGTTLTHALLFGSPARDGGANAGVSAADQRGFSRRIDGDGDGISTVDIGAFEYGLTVNSFNDTVDINPGDFSSADVDGNSTLRAAIMEANARPGEDSILCLPGTYRLTLAGRDENNALTGDLDITDSLTIIGAGDGTTFIDAGGLDRIFHVFAGTSLQLEGVTLINGNSDFGGAILNRGELELVDVSVTDSFGRFGGGIYSSGTSGVLNADILTSTESTVVVFDVTDFPRQAGFTIIVGDEEMRVDSILGSKFSVTRGVNGTIPLPHLSGDSTVSYVGNTALKLVNTNVVGNEALLDGGGIYNLSQLDIETSLVSSNLAGVNGGGIYNINSITIDQTTLDSNVAEVNGGGIYSGARLTGNVNKGTVAGVSASGVVTRSTFSNNDAGVLGGGIFNSDLFDLENSTVSGNSTGSEGGGIYHTGALPQVASSSAEASVTIVLDFIEPNQVPVPPDILLRSLGAFDVTDFGFDPSDFNTVTQGILAAVDDHFLAIPTANVDVRSAIPQGLALDIEFVIGDIGTLPSNGANEFYYVPIGSDDSNSGGGVTADPPIGIVRDASGNASGLITSGAQVGSVYSNTVSMIGVVGGGLTPNDALTAMPGDLNFTSNAIAGMASHVIGHSVSLRHIDAGSAITPSGAPPVMGDAMIDLAVQSQILKREFAYLGQVSGLGGVMQMDVQQLVDALGLRAISSTNVVAPPSVGFLRISNTTIANNSSDLDGGGVVSIDGGITEVRNSIVAGNVANNVTGSSVNRDNDVRGAFVSRRTNFIGDAGSSSGFVNGLFGDQIGAEAAPLDPGIGVLDFNGGKTQTHELQLLSPAIDAGENSGGPANDQRNGRRPTDDTADIGAFEIQQNSMRINDAMVVEGNSGATELVFSVVLDRAAAVPISVNYGTIQGTATQGSDFLATTGTIFFAPDELTQTITVEVNGDTTTEANEEFIVQLFSPANAVLTDAQGVGTILNDDAIVTFADVVVTEGDSGTATATFNVVLSNGTSEPISLGYQTVAGTATPGLSAIGGDYIETNGTLTFASGETSKSFTVTVNGDTTVEDVETFVANLTLTSGSLQLPDPQATGIIQNDDIALANISSPSITELTGSNNTVSFTVGLTTPNAFDVTVDVQTVDGTATGGSDYIALPPTTVTIPAGMTSVTQSVTIIGDTDFEGGVTGTPETFNLEYVAGTITRNGATAAGTVGTAGTASITDDELPPTVWVIRATAVNPTTTGELLRDGTDDGVFNAVFERIFSLTANTETVNGDPGTQNDRFIVDFVNGNPIPDGGLVIDGGDETSGDSLEIVDGSAAFTFDSVVYTSTGVDSGTIVIDDGAMVPTRTVTYVELEPVLDTVAAVDRTFTINSVANPGDHVIGVSNAGGLTIIDDNATNVFESVTFANPSNSLTLNAGDGNNTITVSALDATFATAVVLGTSSVSINGEGGDDNLNAAATNIALSILGGSGLDTLIGGGQNDTINGEAGDDSIDGGAGVDSLAGGDNNDTVKGGAGADSIDGGAGNDSIEGGTEGDILLGNTGDDSILGEDGDDNIDGGTGTDILDGGAGNDTITGGDGGDSIDGGAGMDSLNGNGDADTIDGGADDDMVFGDGGTDSLSGGDGNDTVDGGADNDTLAGGGGTDSLVGGTGVDQVAEVAVDAEEIVLTDTTLTVGGFSDTVNGVEEFILTGGSLSSRIDASAYTLGNVTINGEGGDDTLIGSSGDDLINGGGGNDTLTGSLGNDSMLGGAGSDNIDGGSANDTLAGQGGADTLIGGTGLDSIDGGTGDDVIDGGDDNDTVLGGAGKDSVDGGLGNDRLLGEGQSDTLNGDDGDDTLIGGGGDDMVRGGNGIDNLNGQSGRDDLDGGADDDTAFGGAGPDTLTGGQGIDNLDGQGSSFDTIILTGEATDDVFTLDRSANFNQLRKTSGTTYGVNFKRTETIQINTLDGNDTINVTADLLGSDGDAAFVVDFGNGNNSLDASLNTDPGKAFIVTAGSGNDTLKGSAGEDNLNGAAGDDSIDGGAGEDTLTGGAGADILNGDGGADLVNGGTENDTISGGSEIDTLNAGDGDDSVRGNEGNDIINGEDGDDLLYGDAGNDSISGGRDDDSIDGGTGEDTITGERGFDVIKGGDGNDSLVGGDHDDTIDGGNGNDLVNGNLGRDVLLGGADNDVLLGGSDADTLLGGTGADDIRGQGSSGDVLVGETGLAGAGDDTPDPSDTFDSFALNTPDEIDNAFVLNTAILDLLDSF
jgi:Ca2+-binding RTX toxin-like protein